MANLVGEGGFLFGVSVIVTNNGDVRVWGTEGSSYGGAQHINVSVPLAGIVRVVIDEASVLLWQRKLPPLHLKLLGKQARESAEKVSVILAEAAKQVEERQETENKIEENAQMIWQNRLWAKPLGKEEEDHVVASGQLLAQLSHRCWEGQLKGEFFGELGKTGWMQLVSQTLLQAKLVAQTLSEDRECKNERLVVALLARMLIDPLFRTPSGLVSTLRTWMAMADFSVAVSRLVAIGSDLRESSRVFAAQPAVPVFWLYLDCVYQILEQMPARFAFTENVLSMILLEFSQKGSFSEDFLAVLGACTKPSSKQDLADGMLEPDCRLWTLRLWRTNFLPIAQVPDASAPEIETEVLQLRQTVAKLMTQITAQDAVIKSMSKSSPALTPPPPAPAPTPNPAFSEAAPFRVRNPESSPPAPAAAASSSSPSLTMADLRNAFRLSGAAQIGEVEQQPEANSAAAAASKNPFRIRGPEPEKEKEKEKDKSFVEKPSFRVSGSASVREADPEPPKPSSGLSGAEVLDALRDALSLRSERVETLADETSKMEGNSKSFLEMAKELNAQSQANNKKKWFF